MPVKGAPAPSRHSLRSNAPRQSIDPQFFKTANVGRFGYLPSPSKCANVGAFAKTLVNERFEYALMTSANEQYQGAQDRHSPKNLICLDVVSRGYVQ